MRIGPIVIALRAAGTRFENNIGGAAELAMALEGALQGEMAFVIPLAEDAIENDEQTSVAQDLTERFGVVVALKNDTDPEDVTGLLTYDLLHTVRAQLFKTLVGWDMGYKGITTFRGGRMVGLDSAYLWYQYEFEYVSQLTVDEGGYGIIEETGYMGSVRKYPEEIDNFLRIYSQYVTDYNLHKDEFEALLRSEGNHLPISFMTPDMTQMVDMTEQFRGGFDWADFATAFDFYRQNK
jgi:hypothetical protein